MSYLIDTNVVSELRRPEPHANVVSWFSARPALTLHVSVLTLGELRKGVDALPASPRRQRLQDWLETDLVAYFADRILPVDAAVADRWGRLQAQQRAPLPSIDSLIAATALRHGLTVVTRNSTHFQYAGLGVINPWLQQ